MPQRQTVTIGLRETSGFHVGENHRHASIARRTRLHLELPAIREQPEITVMGVRNSNGTILNEGDSVTVKDLKAKGTSVILKRGMLVKDIHLTESDEEVECRVEKVKGLVLKACFLKTA